MFRLTLLKLRIRWQTRLIARNQALVQKQSRRLQSLLAREWRLQNQLALARELTWQKPFVQEVPTQFPLFPPKQSRRLIRTTSSSADQTFLRTRLHKPEQSGLDDHFQIVQRILFP